jgi:hypothetical protein
MWSAGASSRFYGVTIRLVVDAPKVGQTFLSVLFDARAQAL